MKLNNAAGERGGIIRLVLIVVLIILVVSYFGINLRQVVSSPTTQDNVSYVWTGVMTVWNGYLKAPATALWNFFIAYVWQNAIAGLKNGSVNLSMPQGMASSTQSLPVQ